MSNDFDFAKNPDFDLEEYCDNNLSSPRSDFQKSVESFIAHDLMTRESANSFELWGWWGIENYLSNPKRWKLLISGNDLYSLKQISSCYWSNNQSMTLMVLQVKSLDSESVYHPYLGEHKIVGLYGELPEDACWTENLQERRMDINATTRS